jgi:hypothetical protein
MLPPTTEEVEFVEQTHERVVRPARQAGADGGADRGIFAAGRRSGTFAPALDDDQLAMTFVALEDAYGLHIVGGNALMTVPTAVAAMHAVAGELGCPATQQN